MQQFEIDSKDTKLFNPGIARKEFGKVDPKNPKTLIVETHPIDYKRKIGVYVPAQYKEGTEAPFMVVHDGPGSGRRLQDDPRQPDRRRSGSRRLSSSRSPTAAATPRGTSAARNTTT